MIYWLKKWPYLKVEKKIHFPTISGQANLICPFVELSAPLLEKVYYVVINIIIECNKPKGDHTAHLLSSSQCKFS